MSAAGVSFSSESVASSEVSSILLGNGRQMYNWADGDTVDDLTGLSMRHPRRLAFASELQRNMLLDMVQYPRSKRTQFYFISEPETSLNSSA